MIKDKPFWETRNNPITGYYVEGFKDVMTDFEDERVYNNKGRRYSKSYIRVLKNRGDV